MIETQEYGLSHTRLSMPFVFFGLGRINNYVEDFMFGIIKPNTWSQTWTPIIPNSQLFVSPISNDVTKWKIEIFINPTKALALIILSTVVVLFILGVIIVYYHRREKLEDNPSDTGYGIF